MTDPIYKCFKCGSILSDPTCCPTCNWLKPKHYENPQPKYDPYHVKLVKNPRPACVGCDNSFEAILSELNILISDELICYKEAVAIYEKMQDCDDYDHILVNAHEALMKSIEDFHRDIGEKVMDVLTKEPISS